MKILSLHCDYIKFKPLKKALKNPEELSEERKKEIMVENPLVIMIAVEKHDQENPQLIKQITNEIQDIANKVKSKKIVLYPYSHLSPSLSNPDFALKTLEKIDQSLKKLKFQSVRAPFGYYKEFELKVKGHPLSELSRDIKFSGEHKQTEQESGENIKQLLKKISRSKLDTRKLKENDHRILGQQMNLFSFNNAAPGQVFWHDKGLIIFNELVSHWRELHRKNSYQEISTPFILDNELWKVSGHWKLYRENMFLTEYEKRDFAVKPMNCPGAMLVYRSKSRSYKEFPLRLAELGVVHRKELSGVLSGLLRVIKITQDDAHVFVTNEQLEDEIINVIKIFKELLDKFRFEYKFTVSVRSKEKKDKYLGDDKLWNSAEKYLENGLKKLKLEYEIVKGEAKFYGPSLDVIIKDSLGREWQLSTLQLDFNLPKRFELEYTGKNNKSHVPIILHRVIYGSLERFIGILLEHTNGHLPTWLAPIQVRVINFTDRNNNACEKFVKKLKEFNVRTDFDFSSEPLQGKIKQAEIEKIHYIIVIGDKEEKENTLAVRSKGKVISVKEKEFIDKVKREIEEKVFN
ncbi:MAG: threonine--tRNA ligase [Nanoarchaeota archaeon]